MYDTVFSNAKYAYLLKHLSILPLLSLLSTADRFYETDHTICQGEHPRNARQNLPEEVVPVGCHNPPPSCQLGCHHGTDSKSREIVPNRSLIAAKPLILLRYMIFEY
jgi:hypothetical protein